MRSHGKQPRGAALRKLILPLVLAGTLGFWAGCSVEKNYRTLSFFFDGVPDPNAPKVVEGPEAADTLVSARGSVIYRHRPFAQDNCAACHVGQNMVEAAAVGPDKCMACHQKVPTQYAFMHGPVAVSACLFCHDPHESPNKSLLRRPAPELCLQCHERKELSPKVEWHKDPKISCLECHSGHGGRDKFFLSGPAATTGPATRQAAK